MVAGGLNLEQLMECAYAKMPIVAEELRDKGFEIPPVPEGGFCFRMPIQIPNHEEVGYVSISLAKIVEWQNPNTNVIETALCNKDERLIYIDSLGYSDVFLHEGIDALVKDLRSLQQGQTLLIEERW